MDRWITASEVGEQAFCPEARRLRSRDARVAPASVAAMAQGTAEHVAWAARAEPVPAPSPVTTWPRFGVRLVVAVLVALALLVSILVMI